MPENEYSQSLIVSNSSGLIKVRDNKFCSVAAFCHICYVCNVFSSFFDDFKYMFPQYLTSFQVTYYYQTCV